MIPFSKNSLKDLDNSTVLQIEKLLKLIENHSFIKDQLNLLLSNKKLEDLKDKNIVITDCRFENEYNFLKNINYCKVFFFYVERYPPPIWFKLINKDTIGILPFELHISEWEWIKCLLSNEYTKILNYGSIDDLNTLIDGKKIELNF